MAGNYIRIKIVGEEELRAKLFGKAREFVDEMKRAIPEESNQLASRANQLAPVGDPGEPKKKGQPSGHMKDTLRVFIDLRSRFGVRANLAYTSKYAAAVHEGLHWNKHFRTAGMKWFERALMEFGAGFMGRINDRLKRLVGG
jgi:hypothetical protein